MQPDPTTIRVQFIDTPADAGQPIPLVFRRAQEGETANCIADPVTDSIRQTAAEVEEGIRSRTPEGRASANAEREATFRRKRDVATARALVQATPIPAAEWAGEVWREATSDYVFGNIDEWREAEFDRQWPDNPSGDEDRDTAETEAKMPAWIWATATDSWEPPVGRVIDCIAEDADEQFDDGSERIDFAPLEAFLDEWAPKQSMLVFHEDRSRVIVLDQARYEAELAAARSLIAETPNA